MRPCIILADEQTAALDSGGHRHGLVRKLAVEEEAAIIAVTHEEKILDRLAQFDRRPDKGESR